MAIDNVKTAFPLPSGVKKDVIRNLIWLAVLPTTTASKKYQPTTKNINTSQQKVFRNIHSKRSVLNSLFNKISGLQPTALLKKKLRHRCFPLKLFRTRFLI